MQQRTLVFLLGWLALALVACGGGSGDGAIPTLVPTLSGDLVAPESPRVTQTPEPNVPPTWTPASPLGDPTRLTPPPDVGGGAGEPGSVVEPDENDEIYVVQAGDTLAEIALAFDVDLDLLARINQIENIDQIEVGWELVIPRD